MNKKFTTLAAGLLLAGAFVVSGNAQVLTPTGAVNYRYSNGNNTKAVLATALDPDGQNVYAIDSNQWYQLAIAKPATTKAAAYYNSNYVLTQVRDLTTGALKLQAAPLPNLTVEGTVGVNPSLNNSLWKIVATGTGTRGMVYTFQNKETGYFLSYNVKDVNLIKVTDVNDAGVYKGYASTPLNQLDQKDWLWYSDVNNGTVAFGDQKIYAYTHNNSNVIMALALADSLNYTTPAPVDVVPVEIPSSAASKMSNVNILSFTLVNAGVKVLNAAEINGMINSDEEIASGKAIFKATPAIKNVLFGNKYTAKDVEGGQRGYNVTLSGPGGLLTVNQDTTYEAGKNPTEYGGLIVNNHADATVAAATMAAITATEARSVWKVTYYPTPDSLVLEPYNASIVGTRDAQKGNKWAKTPLVNAASKMFYNTVNEAKAYANGLAADTTNAPFSKLAFVPVALTAMNIPNSTYDQNLVLTVGQPSNAAIGFSDDKSYTKPGAPVVAVLRDDATGAVLDYYQFATMGVRIQFNNTYSYMERATVGTGLYFIKLYDPSATTDVRTNGAYVVDNLAGWMMYDKPASDQNFNVMPATMWVVDQDSCFGAATPTVNIANREYGYFNPKTELVAEKPYYAFQGQLYKVFDAKTGKAISGVYRTLDKNYPSYSNIDAYGKFSQDVNDRTLEPLYQKLHFNEAYTFVPVTDAVAKTTTHGYKAFSLDELTDALENNYYLRYNSFENDKLYLSSAEKALAKATEMDSTVYEIGYATTAGGNLVGDGDFIVPFGWNGTKAALQQLVRHEYNLKVKDANLIDNDQLFVAYAQNPTASDQMWYYTALTSNSIIAGEKAGTAKRAQFYLKADQMHNGVDTAYVLVDIYSSQDNDSYNSKRYADNNGWAQANVIDATGYLRYADLNCNPADRASAFYTSGITAKQYIDLSGSQYAIPASGNIKIYRVSGTANEYLFEDQHDQSGVQKTTGQTIKKGLGYLAIESKGVSYNTYRGHNALCVDPVYNGIGAAMPTYLLCVSPDSVPDGYVCKTQVHGYWKTKAEAEAQDETHYMPYNGYVAARYLVNLQDSVDNNSYMLEEANKYKWQDYTRLAFVEGIHQVDTGAVTAIGKATENLYILKNGYKLADFYTVKNNSFESGYVPGYVLNQYDKSQSKSFFDYKTKAFSANKLERNKNSFVTWSFRKTNENAQYGPTASEPFLMENFDGKHYRPGLFVGAWLKIQNGIPVIAQINAENVSGSHETATGLLNEVINQAQILHFATTDETPTSAVAVSVSNLNVLAGEGNVQILNAAGKKVVVTNILGQTVANEVLSSDNATIAAPSGVVVVAVEGAKAVKAIVK